jgi:adenosylhomocysteine nucleosidase
VPRTLIFAALRWECRCILRTLRRVSRHRRAAFTVWHGDSPAGEVVVVKTGIGVSQAEMAARAVTEHGRFDLCLSTGCAGALSSDLACGDAVIASQLADSDNRRWPVDEVVRMELCAAAQRAALRAVDGAVLCSSRVLGTVEEKRLAAQRTGTVAVEMEGIPIAAHAAEQGMPFASVRVVLDTADTSIDVSAGLVDERTGDVKPLAVARSLVTRRASWSSMRSMQQMLSTAESSLERLFAVYLKTR